MQQIGGLQLAGMSHPADRRCAIFLQGLRADPARGVQPGRCAEDSSMTLSCVFHNIHEEGCVAAVSAHQVEAIEAASDEHIDDRQPEILEGPSAGVHRRRERGTMGAYPIGHGRQCVIARRHSGASALCYSFYNDSIDREGQVKTMLFGVTDGDEDYLAAF